MNRTLSATLAAATLALGAVAVTAADGGRKLSTELTGADEVPGPGDPDGTGSFAARLNYGQARLCYDLSVSGIDPASMAHVHRGADGIAGPVVIGLSAPTSGSSSGCADITRTLAEDLLKNPDGFYVNVHNAAYPGGAVRGQLGD
ncbi:MAG: CHRD domain-containing protein [Novosphingobium sp.]